MVGNIDDLMHPNCYSSLRSMASTLGSLPVFLFGLVASALIAVPSNGQSTSPDLTPVYLVGLSEMEDGYTAVRCELDLLPATEIRRPEVISRVAMEKLGIPLRTDFDFRNEDVFVSPGSTAGKGGMPSATFDITYNGFSSEAQTAFQYAADIWGMLIQSPVPITIEANLVPLGFGVLGSAGPEVIYAEFGAGEANTWYVPALADALAGEDQDSERTDIVANFSSSFGSWYFGTDGQTPPGMIDFVTVVLHEIGHGLGFMGSMNTSCGTDGHGCWGFDEYPGMPIVYDRFVQDETGQSLIDETVYPNPSAGLGTALSSGAVFFDGPSATAGNGGLRPPLYAPNPWDEGSSYAHLDEITFSAGDASALMTPMLSASSALHDPGPVGCGIFGDIGWSIVGDCGEGTVVPTAPNVPVLVSPADGARNQSAPVVIDWREADRATNYDLEVSTSTSFANPQHRIYDLVDSRYTLTDLTAETTYYWRVRSTNGAEESAFSPTYSFTTATAPPAVTVAVLPEDGALGVPTTLDFRWSSAEGAEAYQLQIDTSQDFASPDRDVSDLTVTEFAAADLTRDTRYFWRVRATNAGGAGPWSITRTFTTIMAPPIAPAPASPSQDQLHVSTATSFEWAASDRADSYDLQIALDEAFSRRVVDAERIDTTAYAVSGLKNDTPYFWRVRAENAGGKGDWSPTFGLRTIVAVPAVPVLISPENQLEGLATQLALSWAESARAESYRVQVARTSKFDETDIDTSVTAGTRLEISRLAFQETYYWRVRGINIGGESAWSAARSFTTQISPPFVQPALASPFNGAGGLGLSTRLSWNSVVTADGYQLQLASEIDFTVVLIDTNLVVTNATVLVPDYDSQYFWRVRAMNAGGGGPWSEAFAFSTKTAPPATAPALHAPINASADLAREVEVVWEPIDGADEYDLQISADSLFTRLHTTRSRLRATTFALTALEHDSTYYWRVRARNDGGIGAWSDIWHFTIESAPSGVASEPVQDVPSEFALHQNYPNPFNPQTRIRFEVAQSEYVRMSVYDSAGRLVSVLLEKSMQPGTYEVEWNAVGLPSGVYLCRLEAGDYRGHIPLILMK